MAYYQKPLVHLIWQQMEQHIKEIPTEYEIRVSQDFSRLKTNFYHLPKGTQPYHFREKINHPNKIKQVLFTGFQKCCYPLQKFDSVEGEWRFASILEDDPEVLKWMKPSTGQFQISYQYGRQYEPDFVVETKHHKYIIEIKRADMLQQDEVVQKAKVAKKWCHNATQHAKTYKGKPWFYLLLPHNRVRLGLTIKRLHQHVY